MYVYTQLLYKREAGKTNIKIKYKESNKATFAAERTTV